MITAIVKRDGRNVPFNKDKIAEAIFKAAVAIGGKDIDVANELADQVVAYLEKELGEKVITKENKLPYKYINNKTIKEKNDVK